MAKGLTTVKPEPSGRFNTAPSLVSNCKACATPICRSSRDWIWRNNNTERDGQAQQGFGPPLTTEMERHFNGSL
jgi:hypothetical protein